MSKKENVETVLTFAGASDPVLVGEVTMLGDLMNIVVEQLKVLPKPWESLSEDGQRAFLDRIELQCAEAIRQAVRIISSRGMTNVPATVDSVTFKDGVKAVLKLVSLTDGAIELAKAEGHIVSIIIPEADHLAESTAGKPEAEPDQRAMKLGHEYNDAA